MGKKSKEKKACFRASFTEAASATKIEQGYGGQERKRQHEFQAGLEKIYFFIIRYGTYLILFTPLIVHNHFFFPFVTPKTIFFRILVGIILAAYILLAVSYPRYRPKINVLFVGVGLFLIILILTSFTGINLERSFWSTYERMTGIWTMLHLFAFFVILSSVFRKREDWEKILGVSILVGLLLSLYALFGNELSVRGGGTIGNSSFMAGFLLFSVFFAIILFLAKKTLVWRIFCGVSLTILLSVLFTSEGRGAILAFYGGIFLLILGYLLFSQRRLLKRGALAIIISLVILTSASIVFQPDFLKDRVDRIVSEMKPRFTVWQMGLAAWQERPWLGWGRENFNVGFNQHFNPCLFLSECGGEIWFDRTHNIILETGITSGIFGLLSYLSIFGIAIYGLLRFLLLPRSNNPFFHFHLGMAVLLPVYFFQNLLVFDMINTYMMFFLCLAFISFLTQKQAEEKEARVTLRTDPVLESIVIIILISFLWVGNIQPARSANYTAKMIGAQRIEDANIFFQRALGSWMEKYETREQFARKLAGAVRDPKQSKAGLQKGFELAEQEMEKSVAKNPLDFRHHLFLGKLYGNLYHFRGEEEKLKLSEEMLLKAITLSPTNQQGYWHLAEVRLDQGKNQEAIALLQKAIDLEPRLARSHWFLAIAYKVIGEPEKAKEAAERAAEIDPSLAPQVEELLRR